MTSITINSQRQEDEILFLPLPKPECLSEHYDPLIVLEKCYQQLSSCSLLVHCLPCSSPLLPLAPSAVDIDAT